MGVVGILDAARSEATTSDSLSGRRRRSKASRQPKPLSWSCALGASSAASVEEQGAVEARRPFQPSSASGVNARDRSLVLLSD